MSSFPGYVASGKHLEGRLGVRCARGKIGTWMHLLARYWPPSGFDVRFCGRLQDACGLSYLQVHPTLPNTKNPPFNYTHIFMHMHIILFKRESSIPWTPLYTTTLAPLGGILARPAPNCSLPLYLPPTEEG